MLDYIEARLKEISEQKKNIDNPNLNKRYYFLTLEENALKGIRNPKEYETESFKKEKGDFIQQKLFS